MRNARLTTGLMALMVILLLPACSKKEEGPSEGASPSTSVEQKNTPAAPSPPAQPMATKSGEEVYNGICFSCHNSGVAGAPKLGDRAAWSQRIPEGVDTLVLSVINGKGAMPPKGGETTLNEKEIKAAVEYMVDKAR